MQEEIKEWTNSWRFWHTCLNSSTCHAHVRAQCARAFTTRTRLCPCQRRAHVPVRDETPLFQARVEFICGNTREYFGKNVHVFAEIRLRFCGNKFKKTRKIAPCGTFFPNLSHLPTFTFKTLFNSG